MNLQEYVRNSLELHLFFDRIMKEHSFFIEASLTEKDNNLKRVARNFQEQFTNILKNIIGISNGNVSRDFLNSQEIVTRMTLDSETKSSSLTNIFIDTSLTRGELNLQSGAVNVDERILANISRLNRRSLALTRDLINFKQDILAKVLNCQMFTTNYYSLISHLLDEAKMYLELLGKVERKESFSNNYLYEQELFWNDIMKEHAEFIRGLLDPSEKQLIKTADDYANNYEEILKRYRNNFISLTNASLRETTNFKEFKVTGENGILKCQVKSIIIPLLADHVLREANHFLRLLKSFKLNG